jgi:hypothetical protein
MTIGGQRNSVFSPQTFKELIGGMSMGTNGVSKETKEENPAAGQEKTELNSGTPENKEGHINPSAPEDANVTPGTAGTK